MDSLVRQVFSRNCYGGMERFNILSSDSSPSMERVLVRMPETLEPLCIRDLTVV